MTTDAPTHQMILERLGPGRWRVPAGEEWRNPSGGLWGGYAIGLATRIIQAEPERVGEVLSLTLTYAAALPAGDLDVRTRRIRQGGSVGVWEVELRPPGSEEVGVHAIVTTAKRPDTPPFAFATMPQAPDPDSLPAPEIPHARQHFGSTVLERRSLDGFPPKPSAGSRSLAWVRSRREPMDKALLGMITDNSPPRAMYAFGMGVSTTTLSLTVYLHANDEEVAEVGNDFILVEYEGRVGGGGASDERSSYWRRDGKLLATSEQLVWYRKVPPPPPE
ncbi:MAG: thioesterase family protein [Phenylobacterium sp.]|uniref:acyl-CoA thioesterase n=1 Tax=Phenylobacterium sp. TaxID=1871053 RepID=UPI0025ECCC7D|nr:thioesterase family protein [Phenylobacterium sp.]MCA6247818.1 thioesterase family protein [Phenylobacterium sp.]